MKDQDVHIDNLKASINAKKAPLSLAKARIAMRAKVNYTVRENIIGAPKMMISLSNCFFFQNCDTLILKNKTNNEKRLYF